MKRILFYDVLNIIACFGVIAIHCNQIVNDYANITLADWLQTLLVSIVFMASVPLFFMLSGATLLDYHQRMSTKQFFLRRLQRTVIPFTAWSLLAFVWSARFGHLPANMQQFVSDMLTSQYMPPYWFFIPLFAVYLAMPVLSRLAKDRWSLKYLVAVGSLTIFVLPPLLSLAGVSWNHYLDFPLTGGGYVVYAIVGYLLATADFTKKQRIGIYLLGFGSIIFAYAATVLLTVDSGVPNHAFWEYLYWPSLFFSSAVFLLFRQIPWQRLFASERSQRTLAAVASASLGIYLTHTYGIAVFARLTGLSEYDGLFRAVAPFAVYGVGLLSVLVLKRIPLLRRLVP